MSDTGTLANRPPRRFTDWLRLWFLLRDPVGRRDYAISGVGLMLLKYAGEFVAASLLTGLLYTPLDFINPLISARERFLGGTPAFVGLLWIAWSLPFLWIAVSMSVRRALDAGWMPWFGLLVLVPFVNLAAMLLFAVLPTAARPAQRWDPDENAHQPDESTGVTTSLRAMLGGIAVGALYATVVIQASIYFFDNYGVFLFFGTPFVTGVAVGYLLNLRAPHGVTTTMLMAVLSVVGCGAALLLFAVEGAICLFMAAPIILPLGVVGAPVGKFLADQRRGTTGGLISCLIALPMLAAVESRLPASGELVVESVVEIGAPPEVVWQRVIAFPDITERPEWFFRLGISCPTGARIDGTGVGATRECIFTTGTFVEPITAWDAPRRLAFDVAEQPAPMFELTPYRHIHPPHLDGAFRSTRGEFELIALDDGRTRLVGRTWYTLDIRPVAYWSIWTDWIIHRIHERVLRHIQQLAEQHASTTE